VSNLYVSWVSQPSLITHQEKYLREHTGHGLVSLNDDVLVELACVQAEALIEGRALVVVQVHGDVHGQAEEAAPQLGFPVVEELGLGLEHSGEEVAVPVCRYECDCINTGE